MENEKRFYVYAYYDDLDVPVYIGKGTKNRWRHHFTDANGVKRQTHFIRWLRKYMQEHNERPKIVFLKTDVTNEEALEYEKRLIKEIGRFDLGTGPLLNHTDGGDGSSRRIVSEEEKQYKREIAKDVWTNERRERVRQSLLGRKRPKEVVEKRLKSMEGKVKTGTSCHLSKYFYEIEENGVIIHVDSLQSFCKERKLSYMYLSSAMTNKDIKHYKNLIIYKYKKDNSNTGE